MGVFVTCNQSKLMDHDTQRLLKYPATADPETTGLTGLWGMLRKVRTAIYELEEPSQAMILFDILTEPCFLGNIGQLG
eukprot:5494699-Amphidinium_carterae.2